MGTKIVILVSVESLLIVGCSKTDEEKAWEKYEAARSEEILEELANPDSAEGFDSPKLPPATEGKPINVVSDPGVTYHLLESSKMPNGNLEIVTRRDGSSGTSFARREVDCDAMTFRYLGEGDSLAEAKHDSPNIGEMSEAMSTSISGEVSRFACGQS